MVRVVIFDFDGTIADTFQSMIEVVNTLAIKYRFEKLTSDELHSSSMSEIIKRRHIPMLKIPALLKEYTKLSQEKIVAQNPINKIPQLLKKLKDKDYDLNIITSNSVNNVSAFLTKHNLNFFTYVYSDKSLFGKDIVISRFLRKYNIKREEAIYVGDEIRDIEAANKARIKIISVTWGYNSKAALRQHSFDYLVSQPNQIIEALRS